MTVNTAIEQLLEAAEMHNDGRGASFLFIYFILQYKTKLASFLSPLIVIQLEFRLVVRAIFECVAVQKTLRRFWPSAWLELGLTIR